MTAIEQRDPAMHDQPALPLIDRASPSDTPRFSVQMRRRRWRGRVIVLAALVGLALAIAAGVRVVGRGTTESRSAAQAPPAVPVETAVASRSDVPIYATGLGNVQAFNTVTVRVRVDGELQK